MSIINTIEHDLTSAWGDLEGLVAPYASAIWAKLKPLALTLGAEQASILFGFVEQAIKDVEDGDLADIETAVLNLAEVQEVEWVKTVGSDVLQAFIAVAKL